MPSRYRCDYCQGTLDNWGGPAPVCPNGLGTMAFVQASSQMPEPQTGCKKGKQRFLATSFERDFFVPSTSRGKFNCRYRPPDGNLFITLRLKATFDGSLFRSAFSDTEQEQLKQNLSDTVPAYWNGKCTLRCTRHGWTDIVVKPVFSVAFDGGASHFKLVISPESEASKASKHGRECRGFVSLDQVTSPQATDRVELRDFQTREFNHAVGGLLTAGNDRDFLENALTASGAQIIPRKVATLPFGFGSAEASALAGVIQEFLRRVNLQLPGSHPVPILVQGFAATAEPSQLASKRADAIVKLLQGPPALKNKNPITLNPIAGTGKSAVEIKIDHAYEESFTTGQQQFQYSVAAHEFGHMIGLPDEYENPTEGSKLIVKKGFQQLVHRAGLISPDFPSHTSSMMSDGMTLMPWHYVTMWEALTYLTRDFLNPDEWVIHVPG